MLRKRTAETQFLRVMVITYSDLPDFLERSAKNPFEHFPRNLGTITVNLDFKFYSASEHATVL
jgi:hypothetical protein